MAAPYKLRCNIHGHEKDVRAVAPSIIPDGGIVSGSRDMSARIWTPDGQTQVFIEGHIMGGHTNFVSSVCVMPPDDTYPSGIIYTGSNDSTILAFTLDSPQPVAKLTGHSGNVCALAIGKFSFLVSGSWDMTAKVWLKHKCVMTLQGHEAAVWAVAVMSEQGIMLTGSADRTIKLFKAGKCEKTFTGHDDCVRGLAVLQDGEFLSCSNDATVKHWLLSGDCLHTYYGHTNFVYSIALLPNGQDFVTSSEDRTVRVWKNRECIQTIAQPTQSVWSVCALQNGDIVVGSSDGVIRVFTNCPDRMASPEEQQAFSDEVAATEIPTEVGDIKMEDLPGPEALLDPGKKDGQTKMVRQGGKVQLYHWDASESQWAKIGDVVGSSGGTQKTSGKTLFEGKEYDYVFTVDIQEGAPPLKLPYNITEDPWFAAQQFLDRNELSQAFLDQVANFIIDNTKGVTLSTGDQGYTDPLTGSNRYVPGSVGATPVGGSDPFTGAGRYVPGGGQTGLPNTQPSSDPFTGSGRYRPPGTAVAPASSYFPIATFITFDNADPAKIVEKLKEFNSRMDVCYKVEDSQVDNLSQLLSGDSTTPEQLATLKKILSWPQDVFPALDILRIIIKQPAVLKFFNSQSDFLPELLRFTSPDGPVANQMLSLRVLANLFSQSEGMNLVYSNRSNVVKAILDSRMSTNQKIHIAIATVLLNLAIVVHTKDDLDGKSECLSAAQTLLQVHQDAEAIFRTLVSVGTIVHGDEESMALALSLDIHKHIAKFKTVPEPKKLSECAKQICDILN